MGDHLDTPLSARAKGKQRAIDPIDDEDDLEARTNGPPGSYPEPSTRLLTIRFTEGVHDLTLTIDDSETVRDIKKQIRSLRPSLQRRRLRLIHSGRLLTDGTYLFGWLKSLEGHQRRANGQSAETAKVYMDSEPAWLHCSIGLEIAEEEEEEETSQDQKSQLTPLRGFDRLVGAGFSEEDVATIRRQFRAARGLDGPSSGALDDDDDEHARALEEQWIDSGDGPDTALDQSLDGTPDGLYATLLEGITTGFFFVFLPLFFMRGSRPPAFFSDEYDQVEYTPSVVFSKRMQMTIVMGLLVNILLGLFRWAY